METVRDTVVRCVRRGVSSLWLLTRAYVTTVLAIIQEKINNPSPDDPFEPDIAAVRELRLALSDHTAHCQSLATEERSCEVPGDGEGMDEEVNHVFMFRGTPLIFALPGTQWRE